MVIMEDVSRRFGEKTVLSNIDLTVTPGEVVGLVGPNGGGKSTLLLLMAGLLRPHSGSVTVCGTAAHALSLTAAGSVGLVTARPGLYPLLTGRENLHHFGGLFALSRQDVESKAQPLAQALGLTAALEQRVGSLSTGMQQKLSLVRALILSPVLLLFDEPTANLDPMAGQALYEEIRSRANTGLACVLVTHDLFAAEAVCDRVLFLDAEIKREVTFRDRREAPTGPLFSAWQQAIGGP